MNIFAAIRRSSPLLQSSYLWSHCRQTPLLCHSLSPSTSTLFSVGVGGNSKAWKSHGGKAGKGQGQGKGKAVKARKGQGNAGGWPSTSGNPSGSGRSNAAPKSSKASKTPSPQQKESLKTIQRLEQEKNALIKEKKSLQKGMATLEKKLNNRPDVPILFHGQYNFGRDNVVDLSRLISRYLVNKPKNIDRDRIYDCVCECCNALGRGYNDNPDYYYEDVRMLAATFLASNWFSENQRSSIEEWYRTTFR